MIAGKYRVERVLGQGGMGVVVVAMHDELDQRVAIKFLLPEAVKDAEWVARFSREAKAAAKIRSEHVVRVFDVGKLPDGAPYMVMEFLEGKDLQSILNDRHHFSIEEAVDFVLQACEALAEAHAAGIVHRDLKPANLFLAHRSDGSPCVKVLDFGISKLAGPNDVSVTSTQAIVGSPLYMSPEQMKAAKNVDKRSDVWSLGVLLQELVTGSPSFIASTSAELCALVLTASPTPLRVALPTAPAELERIVARCLEKNPDARYPNVGELARDLLPLAPGAATSVDRILRLSGVANAPRPSLVGDRVVVPTAAAFDPNLSTTEATVPPTTSSPSVVAPDAIAATQLSPGAATGSGQFTLPAPTATPPVGGGTQAAWGTPAKPASSSRTALFAAAGLGGLLLLGLGGWAATRSSGGGTTSTTPATSAPEHGPTTTTAEPTGLGAGAPTGAAVPSPTTPTIPLSALPTAATATPTAPSHAHASASAPVTASAPSAKPSAAASAKNPPTVNTSGFGGRN
jgi:serine/threonine-protein kinase